MNYRITEDAPSIAAQATEIPAMYGRVDFAVAPERFTLEPNAKTDLEPEFAARRPDLLADEAQVTRIRAFTMCGDHLADAYAALIPKHGFNKLVDMLASACEHGLESVTDAPPELERLIRDMEQLPTWLDRDMIERGARIERNGYANRAPFAIRVGLIPTFMNKYTALPMVLTGALSSKASARRIHETATFFATTVMPDVLDRHGGAFKSAAMVRLMHAMVRFNLLQNAANWDVATYGIPIPQVDQVPIGFLSAFHLAVAALRQGRPFTSDERAQVEIGRYRCFLLGLPEALLPDTPHEIVALLLTRHATLRKEADDNCNALVKATMTADLTTGHSLPDRFHGWLERGFSRVSFLAKFAHGDKRAAEAVGVSVGFADYVAALCAGIVVNARVTAYALAAHLPGMDDVVDGSLVRRLTKQLSAYGHADFTTNPKTYRAAHAGS
jgi:hypothetical protein